MKNYVIINGVNSLTITGLAISKLPSISKPPLRVMTEEINGRDGDLITELGYGAYDKELVIGLYGNYDINEVIGFFNQEGTIVFSNEDDKYYNFKIINQIDYEALIKFRTATISLHCQPFKYPLTETPEEITTEYVEDEGETLTLNDTKIAPLSITPKGNTSQIQYSGSNLIGLSTTQCPVTLHVGDKIVAKNTSSTAYTLNLYTNYGDSTRNDFWTVNGNGTKTITIAYETGAIAWNGNITGGVAWVNKGETIQNYEPYVGGTPSPNPDYPQNVNVVSGDNEVVVTSKNIYNKVTSINNKTFTTNTGVLTDNSNYITSDFIKVSPNTTYYVYGLTVVGGYDNNKNWVALVRNADTNGTFTTPNNCYYVRIRNYSFLPTEEEQNARSEVTYLTLGNQPITYVPYQGVQNYPLYLGVENLLDLKNGTYGNNGVTAVVTNGQVLLNGTPESGSSFITIQLNKNINWVNGKDHTIMINNNTSIGTENTYGAVRIDLNGTLDTKFNIANNYKVVNIDVSNVYNDKIQIRTGYGITYNNYVIEPKIIVASKPNYISDTPIELCDIGNYTDLFFKAVNGDKYYDTLTQAQKDLLIYGKWYLHKEIGKVVLNGSETWEKGSDDGNRYYFFTASLDSQITSTTGISNYFPIGYSSSGSCINLTLSYAHIRLFMLKTLNIDSVATLTQWLNTNNVSLYYVLGTPIETEITNSTLINQLEALKGAMSYEGQTNISQVNNDLPFILKVKGTKEGSGEGIINNIGNIYAKPIIELEGTGNIGIYKNGTQYFEVDMSSDNEITIDTEKMEAYHNGVLKNRKVIGDYNKFTIDEGNNNIEITGELTKATITKYVRYL